MHSCPNSIKIFLTYYKALCDAFVGSKSVSYLRYPNFSLFLLLL